MFDIGSEEQARAFVTEVILGPLLGDFSSGGMSAPESMRTIIALRHSFRDGPMVIRTTTSASVPCPDLGLPKASVGEKWLIGGSGHNTLTEALVELRVSMRLDDGRLPNRVEWELRRIKVAD